MTMNTIKSPKNKNLDICYFYFIIQTTPPYEGKIRDNDTFFIILYTFKRL